MRTKKLFAMMALMLAMAGTGKKRVESVTTTVK